MINLDELRQLVAFAELGTLSRVAEQFHVSTPSVTRAMQYLEEAFAVPLFTRGKNRIILNETGWEAVESARRLLEEAELAVVQVRAFDQRRRTVTVGSCAPAPLWALLPLPAAHGAGLLGRPLPRENAGLPVPDADGCGGVRRAGPILPSALLHDGLRQSAGK